VSNLTQESPVERTTAGKASRETNQLRNIAKQGHWKMLQKRTTGKHCKNGQLGNIAKNNDRETLQKEKLGNTAKKTIAKHCKKDNWEAMQKGQLGSTAKKTIGKHCKKG
jgi:hypothetical protein